MTDGRTQEGAYAVNQTVHIRCDVKGLLAGFGRGRVDGKKRGRRDSDRGRELNSTAPMIVLVHPPSFLPFDFSCLTFPLDPQDFWMGGEARTLRKFCKNIGGCGFRIDRANRFRGKMIGCEDSKLDDDEGLGSGLWPLQIKAPMGRGEFGPHHPQSSLLILFSFPPTAKCLRRADSPPSSPHPG